LLLLSVFSKFGSDVRSRNGRDAVDDIENRRRRFFDEEGGDGISMTLYWLSLSSIPWRKCCGLQLLETGEEAWFGLDEDDISRSDLKGTVGGRLGRGRKGRVLTDFRISVLFVAAFTQFESFPSFLGSDLLFNPPLGCCGVAPGRGGDLFAITALFSGEEEQRRGTVTRSDWRWEERLLSEGVMPSLTVVLV
jgi:hypothetical protein